jgi:hypothetical protein
MVDKEQIAYTNGPKVQLRRATSEDAEACGRIFMRLSAASTISIASRLRFRQ